jgi:hypothetical protein
MPTTSTIVYPSTVSDYWGASEGRTCDLLREYFRNGEHHMSLRDRVTGEVFTSPSIFWTEIA